MNIHGLKKRLKEEKQGKNRQSFIIMYRNKIRSLKKKKEKLKKIK